MVPGGGHPCLSCVEQGGPRGEDPGDLGVGSAPGGEQDQEHQEMVLLAWTTMFWLQMKKPTSTGSITKVDELGLFLSSPGLDG